MFWMQTSQCTSVVLGPSIGPDYQHRRYAVLLVVGTAKYAKVVRSTLLLTTLVLGVQYVLEYSVHVDTALSTILEVTGLSQVSSTGTKHVL
jgi:hypothetical protein